MSRILLTDAEQLRSKIEGVGFQVAAVLAGPNGGVTLELSNPVTEAKEVVNLPREQAEALVEQVTATLRCNAPDPYKPAADRFDVWTAAQTAARLLGQTDAPCTGSRAVG
ncbi:hypothetical protein [Deinococcus sp. UYEF24]